MIDHNSISEWLNTNPIGLIKILSNPQAPLEYLQIAATWQNDKTGNSILSEILPHAIVIRALYGNASLLQEISTMIARLRQCNYIIINGENKKGETPLNLLLNIDQSDTVCIGKKHNKGYGITTKYLRKLYSLPIIKMLIDLGGYYNVNKCSAKDNQFLFNALCDKIKPADFPEFSNLNWKSSVNTLEKKDFLSIAVNMLFHRDNIAEFSLKKNLARLIIAAGHLKSSYHPLSFILRECFVQPALYAKHLKKYANNGKTYYRVQPAVLPHILKDIQVILYQFCETFREEGNETLATRVERLQNFIMPDKPAKDMFTMLTLPEDKYGIPRLLSYMVNIKRCFSSNHKKLMEYYIEQVLLRLSECDINKILSKKNKVGLYNLLSNSIINHNTPFLEKVIAKIGCKQKFRSIAYIHIEGEERFPSVHTVQLSNGSRVSFLSLMHDAVISQNYEAIKILLDVGISPNTPASYTAFEVQKNPTLQMQKIYEKYWFCGTNTIISMKSILSNASKVTIFVGAVTAIFGLLYLYYSNIPITTFVLSKNLIACVSVYCCATGSLLYAEHHPEILPDTIGWIMRSIEKFSAVKEL